MPRPRGEPTNVLGVELIARRGARSLAIVGAELGVTHVTLSGIERGTHRPSYDTAVKLATWLGWTTDHVMQAAEQPASQNEPPSQER